MSRILYSVIILLLAVTFLTSCSGKNNVNKDMTEVAGQVKPPVEISIGKETELLLKDLEENGDYVNSREYPSLIRASIVHDELNGNNLVIDLRSPQKYTAGHIRGAVIFQATLSQVLSPLSMTKLYWYVMTDSFPVMPPLS